MQINEFVSGLMSNIDIKHAGVYLFTSESGMGKSYLAELLGNLKDKGACAITYHDNVERQETELGILKAGEYELILLDRYALYANNEWNKAIKERSKDRVILIDCKNERSLELDGTGTVYLNRSTEEMIVCEEQ